MSGSAACGKGGAILERAQGLVRRRQIGRISETHQHHFGGRDRTRRRLHLGNGLKQHLPGARQRAHRQFCRELGAAPLPLLTTVLCRDEHELRFFSTITTFATSRDVTLDELHIECCFPVDEATVELCRLLAEQMPDPTLSPV